MIISSGSYLHGAGLSDARFPMCSTASGGLLDTENMSLIDHISGVNKHLERPSPALDPVYFQPSSNTGSDSRGGTLSAIGALIDRSSGSADRTSDTSTSSRSFRIDAIQEAPSNQPNINLD